jgi:predicted transcriptional regulator
VEPWNRTKDFELFISKWNLNRDVLFSMHRLSQCFGVFRGHMTAATSKIRRMSGLLSEGLRVRQISNLSLATCKSSDDSAEVLNRPTLAEFDQIPILDGKRIVGILERNGKKQRPLDDSLLVSADEHLALFIFTLKSQPYRLVVDGTAIKGIVTWSDLLKAPVLLFAYALIAELELLMNGAIQIKYGGDDRWILELDKDEQNAINKRKRKLEKENLILPTIELADFAHKAKVIHTPFLDRFHFDTDLAKLIRLRNSVAHVHEVVRSDADLHRFVEELETATAWTNTLFEPTSHLDGESFKKKG